MGVVVGKKDLNIMSSVKKRRLFHLFGLASSPRKEFFRALSYATISFTRLSLKTKPQIFSNSQLTPELKREILLKEFGTLSEYVDIFKRKTM